MKKLVLLAALAAANVATAQMDVPPPGFNIRANVSEEVGITSISIAYSRPGVKGREGKIWGGVVPYGFGATNFLTGKATSPWRAGANQATVISFEHDVKLEGKDLKAGAYALFMAMSPDTVTLIFSKQKEAWGSFFYRPEDDVLRVQVKPVVLDKPVEWLKYEFLQHTETGCVIAMQWEKVSVPFRVDVDVNRIVLERLRQQMTGEKGFLSANLIQASMYFFGQNENLEEAVAWARRAVNGQPFGQTAFDAYRNLATGFEKLKHQPQADSVMNVGLTVASAAQHASYGRSLLAQKRTDRALEVLQAAEAKFGNVYAVSNALSYAYAAKKDYSKALDYASKALAQAASPQAKNTVNANIQKLKEGKDIN